MSAGILMLSFRTVKTGAGLAGGLPMSSKAWETSIQCPACGVHLTAKGWKVLRLINEAEVKL
jgi:hypothetical protein